jgi:hypothetical protein
MLESILGLRTDRFGIISELLIENSCKNKTTTNFKYMLNICKFKLNLYRENLIHSSYNYSELKGV